MTLTLTLTVTLTLTLTLTLTATSRGLLAMAFAPRGGAGLVQIVSTSPLALLLELPLESVPRAIKLKGVPGNEHFLTVGFEAGGVEGWVITPELE